ncbi:Hsp70 protein-domain-containing protein [Colletotrichum cereale]|nr:Hsp70 protein-domain-containing protein [Colletotrichum cereale]
MSPIAYDPGSRDTASLRLREQNSTMCQSIRNLTSNQALLLTFAVILLLFPCFAVTSKASERDVEEEQSHIIAISIGPSFSSVGKVQHGAIRIPLAGHSNAVMKSDKTMNHTYSNPNLSNALFNMEYMVCKPTEPHYFMHAAIENPCQSDGLSSDLREGQLSRETLSEIFCKLKGIAEDWTQHAVESVVVAVPAYYTENDRSIVRNVGASVGLEVVRITNTYTAVGLGYGIDKSDDESGHVVFYQLGRAHFEVSVAEVDMGVFDHCTTVSDPELGKKIGEVVASKQSTGAHYFGSPEIDLFGQTLKSVDRAIREANLSRTDIAHLVITGEYTRNQQVRSLIEAFFDGKRAVGVDDREDSELVPGSLDHDEPVTLGVALLADILAGHERHSEIVGNFSLQPRSLSVETIGGGSLRAFHRWTILPASKVLNLTTTVDGQSTVVVSVFQGELPEVRKNDEVVVLRLDCIPSSPRGTPKITLVLEVYADEVDNIMLNATAHLVGGNGDCSDSAPAVLHDFYDINSITSHELDLEAAFVSDMTGQGLFGSCFNRQDKLDQHYVTAKESKDLILVGLDQCTAP